MKNIKLIALDLDGTLLRSDKTVSDYTLDILRQCRKKGILISIATARSEKQSLRYIERIQPDIIVSDSGALATYKSKVLYKASLSKHIADDIFRRLKSDKGVTCITADAANNYYRSYNKIDSTFATYGDFLHGQYFDFSKPLGQEVYKITAEIISKEIAENIAREFHCSLTCFRDENWYKFASTKANKLQAIKAVAEYFNIVLQETAAFGDDYNDLELLSDCGFGVAMGNAIDEVKLAAKYITDTNDNNGVAKWLKENI